MISMSEPTPENLSALPLETSWRQDLGVLKQQLDFQAVALFLLAALMLTLQAYFANIPTLSRWLKPLVAAEQLEMWASLAWCGSIVLLYLLLPLAFVKGVFKASAADYGLSFKGLRAHYKPYLLFFAIMLLPLIYAATTPAFQQMYPFFKYVRTSWWLFCIWQVAYALQFVAVEFFFRGLLLFGLWPRFGVYSLLISMIPYCMIHFQKPLGEALGAIFAGLVLGYLAYKNRSIWGGAALHWGVALSMDLLAILFSRVA